MESMNKSAKPETRWAHQNRAALAELSMSDRVLQVDWTVLPPVVGPEFKECVLPTVDAYS